MMGYGEDDENANEKIVQETSEYPFVISIAFNFGIIVYLFDINGVISDVRGQMKQSSQFGKVLKKYFTIMSSIAIILGVLGYLTYKENTQANIFMNLHYKGLIKGHGDLLAAFYSLGLIISIVLYNYPIQKEMDQIFINESNQQNTIEMTNDSQINQRQQYFRSKSVTIKRHCIRLFLFFFELLLSIAFPKIESVVSIMGCIFSVCLGFVIPYIFYIRQFNKDQISNKPMSQNKALVILIIGLVGGTLGLISTILQ